MAKTMKAMGFRNIKEVELLISAIEKSVSIEYDKVERHMLLNMEDVLGQVREMFIKETRKKEKANG